MEEKQTFIESMQRAMGELEVKASLAKLELGDVKKELIDEYDHLHDRLVALRDQTEDEWAATKGGIASSWEAFKARFHEVMHRHDPQGE
ncbi:MAG: hypothetical protein AAGD14_13340 [Planctomycetota bacterium]